MKWRIDYEKNFLTILLCGVMVLGMTGCGKQKNEFDIGNKSDIKISQNDGITTIKEGTLTNKSAPIWKSLWNRD